MTVASVVPKLRLGALKFKIGHVMRAHPFQGQFVVCRFGPNMMNLSPNLKFLC